MGARDTIARQIQLLRPQAKFIAVSHSSDFIPAEAELGDGFFTGNLYDERIDANMIVTKQGSVMIQNTYIASFAYNLFLCWLYGHRNQAAPVPLDRLLAHNFKKFFAEQVYRRTNRIPARALLLETLLFEQIMMEAVFAAKDGDTKLSADAEAAAGLMSLALSMHELGHYYLKTKPGMWEELVQAEPDTVGSLYSHACERYADLVTEFQCDAYAVIGCLRQYESHAGAGWALRALVFAFAAYAAMYSAAATATDTAALWDAGPAEHVDLLDIAPMPHVEHDVKWAIDKPFLGRVSLVAKLCERLASKRGLRLFDGSDPFPLPPTIIEDLMRCIGRVFECDDANARKMSNLVARSLHGHDAGMEYLYLRSKVFRTNRTEPLIVPAA